MNGVIRSSSHIEIKNRAVNINKDKYTILPAPLLLEKIFAMILLFRVDINIFIYKLLNFKLCQNQNQIKLKIYHKIIKQNLLFYLEYHLLLICKN